MVELAACKQPSIAAARASDLASVQSLFRAYAEWLDYAICFEGFEQELRDLPGDYVAPLGGLWLARLDGTDAGVIALRRKSEGVGEIKRLWVAPAGRGHGLGRRLVETALTAARRAGYGRLYLETLEQMQAARELYGDLGFSAVSAKHPDGRIEMELALRT